MLYQGWQHVFLFSFAMLGNGVITFSHAVKAALLICVPYVRIADHHLQANFNTKLITTGVYGMT